MEYSMESGSGCWQTKDGIIVNIADMNDEHLVNSIRLLKRVVRRMRFSHELAGWYALNFVQGEMAEYAIESDLQLNAGLSDEEWLERHTPYEELIGEAKRRGILDYIGVDEYELIVEKLYEKQYDDVPELTGD